MPGDDVRLLVLRHGRSEWNAVRRWQGSYDSPLDAVGRSQAAAVADELAATDIVWARPVTSTLGRAAETAEIISRRLALEPPRTDDRLVEAHAGEWQGLTPDEIEAAYPGWLAAHRRPAGFEALDSVVARATAALVDAGREVHDGHCGLVVSHSGLIRSVVRSLGLTDTRIPNLGGIWFRVVPRSDSSADRSHVAGAAFDRDRVFVDDVFDPGGVVISGVDAPGEDPGEQSDETQHDGRSQR